MLNLSLHFINFFITKYYQAVANSEMWVNHSSPKTECTDKLQKKTNKKNKKQI